MAKRVFLIVLDSFGIGEAPDAAEFGDSGSNTLAAVLSYSDAPFTNLARMGLLSIDGENDARITAYKRAQQCLPPPIGSYGRVRELSRGKDSTVGHWEMCGIISETPQPTYPNGFPDKILNQIKQITGRDILCNRPYSGTDVIRDYGDEHEATGSLIVYTSADSVLQVAAHEDVIPVDELYRICGGIREIMTDDNAVGRVIARPFTGTSGNYTRTPRRHDFSLPAPSSTALDALKGEGFDVISIGKISDLFAGRGITETYPTHGNTEGIARIKEMMNRDFTGLCFANLVDFDMLYGHRNNIEGYALAMHEFDSALGDIISSLKDDDLLMITADHGCDPSTASTDHSRECIPLLMFGDNHRVAHNLGELIGFGNISDYVINALMERREPHIYEPETDSHKTVPSDIMSYVDLTNLKVTATKKDIETLITKAVSEGCASVCIPPCFVPEAKQISAGRIAICTVIGFPNGYQTTAAKLFEAADACDNGASEIDMVINTCFLKSHLTAQVQNEIELIARVVHDKGAILKVIIETCNLSRDEISDMCKIVSESGADFIKTSTGFGSEGATVENVRIMAEECSGNIRIKAAGGIRTRDTAAAMIEAGASRIGASKLGD